jgi:Ca2+-binding RTX toxin-like protein
MAYVKYDGSAASVTAAATADLNGADAADTISGTAGPDNLYGASKGDVLVGGAGDDTYWFQTHLPYLTVRELAGGGVDTIKAWQNVNLADFPEVENLSVGLDGIYGGGNARDNVIEGGDGAQQLYGGAGQDVLVGGAGKDVFIVYKGEGNDVIQDFNAAQDTVRLKAGFTTFAEVQARLSQVGSDVKLDLGGGDGLVFRNLAVGQLTASNFQLQLDLTGYTRTFNDDFNGLSLRDPESAPTGTWRTDYGYQGVQGVGSYTLVSNNEKQIYTSPYFREHNGDFAESPFAVNGDGTVSIWARPSANSELFGYGFTSGLLSTKDSFTQTYGYFEMRADLPDAVGAWPAFWLLPADGSWPPELDVMEALSTDSMSWTTKHWGTPSNHGAEGVQNFVPGEGFHTYGALWTAGDIRWYVDGVEVNRTTTPADMNKPMFMIANLALGGWAGTVDATHLPAEMKIDYIRAYQLPTASTPTPPPPAPPPAPAPEPAPAPLPPPAPSSSGGSGGSGYVDIYAPKVLVALAGGDTLKGAAGADILTGGDGEDLMEGGDGADRLYGGGGWDRLQGNMGDDVLSGGLGDDWVVGGKDSDVLGGDDGADIVYGNLGDDTCDGGAGADLLRGGQGDDRLLGQAGDDWLSGDRGNDTITGGLGADIFHSFTGAGTDLVTDFSYAAGDRVQLDPGDAFTYAQVGSDVVVTLGAGDRLILQGVQLSTLGEGWLFGA